MRGTKWWRVHRAPPPHGQMGACCLVDVYRLTGRPRRRRRRRQFEEAIGYLVLGSHLTALVDAGAGVETACAATGETAVHVAANCHPRCLATNSGANRARDLGFGRTAAHFAVLGGAVHNAELKSLHRRATPDFWQGIPLLVDRDRYAPARATYADDRVAPTPRRGSRALAAGGDRARDGALTRSRCA